MSKTQHADITAKCLSDNTDNSDSARVFTSHWIVTPDGVIESGALALDGERITFVGPQSEYQSSTQQSGNVTELGDSVIIPGLINAHVHTNFPADTKLSFQRGSMTDWVKAALSARESRDVFQQREDVTNALERMQKAGIVAIGEIANDFVSLEPIVQSGMICRFFAERLGFQSAVANDVTQTLIDEIATVQHALPVDAPVTIHPAPHAPYSCSSELIRRLTALSNRSTIHVAENKEEMELLADGSGLWRERLREIGKDDPQWSAPRLSPIQYLHSLGVLQKGMSLVHAVHVDEIDINLIAASGATVVLCLSSNEYIGVGRPPVIDFVEQGVPLALGTDSLASNSELDMFAEVRCLRELFPGVSRKKILALATSAGSKALGYERSLGSLEVGKAPGVFAVDLSDLSAGSGALDFASEEDLLDALITVGAEGLQQLAPAKLQ